MNTCGLARLFGVAWLVGFVVSSLAGSSTSGWVAGLVTLAVMAAARRARGTGSSCAISSSGATEVASDTVID
jgi:hypothetical protein